MGALTLHYVGSTFSRDTDVVQHSRYTGLKKYQVVFELDAQMLEKITKIRYYRKYYYFGITPDIKLKT